MNDSSNTASDSPQMENTLNSNPATQSSSMDGADPVLLAARDDLSNGDLPRALHAYNHLIRRNRALDELLPDLAQLVKQYPREPRVWQTLGDALKLAGNQDHAAQSYDRARKLVEAEKSTA